MASRSEREAGRVLRVMGLGTGLTGGVEILVLMCREWCGSLGEGMVQDTEMNRREGYEGRLSP